MSPSVFDVLSKISCAAAAGMAAACAALAAAAECSSNCLQRYESRHQAVTWMSSSAYGVLPPPPLPHALQSPPLSQQLLQPGCFSPSGSSTPSCLLCCGSASAPPSAQIEPEAVFAANLTKSHSSCPSPSSLFTPLELASKFLHRLEQG